jgi:hypothetical protein
MAAYNGKSKLIKNGIKALVATIKYDTGSGPEDAYSLVTDGTKDEFDTSPVLQILPGNLDPAKGTTGQDDRTLTLILRTHLQFEASSADDSTIIDHMLDLTDLLIDTIGQADHDEQGFVGTGISAWLMDAQRGDWFVKPLAEGADLTCDVNVQVKYSKDL